MLVYLDTLIGFVVVMAVVSLLITVITQIVSAALGLRGKNLADALVAMIRTIDPSISSTLAQQLADKALTTPITSDCILSMESTSNNWLFWWKRATAIRVDELLGVFKDIANPPAVPAKTPTTPEQAAAAAKLIALLSVPTPETTQALHEIKAQLPALAAARGAAIVEELNAAANVTLSNLEKWFNSAQDRAQQWFAIHTRIVTIIASVVAAFVLQLDAFRLIQHISSDPDVRSKLVAESDTLRKQAAKVLEEADANQSIQNEAINALKKKYTDLDKQLGNPPDTMVLSDLDKWLRIKLSDNPQKEEIIDAYNKAVNESLRKKLDALGESFVTIGRDLDETGLELFPTRYPTLHSGQWSWPFSHLVGILAAAALLSLGAPFWFNTLKTLSNMRSILADEVDKNPKQIPAKS
jgi:hypothetical protein